MREEYFSELIIKLEEGYVSREYHCSEGFRSIGYGRKLSNIKFETLGNTVAIEKEEIVFVRQRIADIISKLSVNKKIAWCKCNEQRQAILISLAYQVGVDGILKFKKMWAAIEMSNFEEASRQMLDSLWAKQTKNRALRHAKTMKDGTLDMYYLSKGAFN